MSKCTEIREICGDYAFDVEYSEDNRFTMFFNSMRNAKTVKRCIEIDDSVPNAATAVDFVEVVRCEGCVHWDECGTYDIANYRWGFCRNDQWRDVEGWEQETNSQDFCSYGERKEQE